MTQRDETDLPETSLPETSLPEASLPPGKQGASLPQWPGWPVATAQAVRFYSRLPVPALRGEADPHAAPDFRLMPRALPVAAMVIALPAVGMATLASFLDMPAMLVAALTLGVLTLSTGAFHEDGLADTFDGLFGGHDKERRLEIMKDSRIGTFGGCALMLGFLLRFACLVALIEEGSLPILLAALMAAAVWSRVLGIHVLAIDAPARAYGALATVGMPTVQTARIALGLGAGLCLIAALMGGAPILGLMIGLALAAVVGLGMAATARRLIGGPTGDIAGAVQQLSEICVYLGLVLALV
jgi:adenosylcobinamide-GDP ribazoletransferase